MKGEVVLYAAAHQQEQGMFVHLSYVYNYRYLFFLNTRYRLNRKKINIEEMQTRTQPQDCKDVARILANKTTGDLYFPRNY